MAELMFKRGSQAALDAIIVGKKAIDGCFYLTEDTNRLYVGQGENTAPVLLNQTVQVVANARSLPASPPAAENDFYYCVEENVLAVFENGQWNQINTNTDNTIKVTSVAFDDGTLQYDEESNPHHIDYKLTVKQTKYDIDGSEVEDANLKDIEATLTIGSELIANIVPESAKVGLTASNIASNGGVEIKTEGAGSDSTNIISLVGGANIDSIATSGDSIVIDAHDTTYEFSTQASSDGFVEMLVVNSDSDQEAVGFKTGTSNDDLVVDQDGGSIIYSHKNYTTENVSVENNEVLSPEGSFDIISGIELSNGHISAIHTDSITLPPDTAIQSVNNNGDWTSTITETNENTYDISFAAEAQTLKEELERKIADGLAAANTALTYKGTIPSYNSLAGLEDVEVGDVYLLSRDDGSYITGDMFIATSKDSSDTGIIDTGNLEWTYVPSGNELNTDTFFTGVAEVTGNNDSTVGANGKISYHIKAVENANRDDLTPDSNQTLELNAGTDLVINKNDAVGNTIKATINHKTITTATLPANDQLNSAEFTAVTGVNVENGHVVGLQHSKFTPVTYNLSGSDNKIKLADSNNGDVGSVDVAGDDWVTAEVKNNQLTIKHNVAQATNATVSVTNNTNLTESGPLNIISGVSYDTNGHITEVATTPLTLPQDTTYQLITSSNSDGTVANNTKNPYLVLKDRNSNVTYTQVTATADSSIEVVGNSNKIAINLVWGSF